jgi:DNA polymerase III delta prime subunit
MEIRDEQFLWVEKYRPRTLADCILPDDLKQVFQNQINKGQIQNMLLCGTAGTGKTTVAKALCEELGVDFIVINGSLDGGIDTLRTKIKDFASTVSFGGGVKVVILDEADYLTPATQPALRNFIEEFSANCRFIFTCNFKHRIIEPLWSRLVVIEFKIAKSEKPAIASRFMKRVKFILDHENITYDEKAVAAVVMKHFPDYRRTINDLQRHAGSGNIDSSVLTSISDSSFDELVKALKEKDFKSMRTWVVNNNDDPNAVFRKIYDTLTSQVSSVPQLIILLADYQYKSAFVVDQEINLVACLTEIMADMEFKS